MQHWLIRWLCSSGNTPSTSNPAMPEQKPFKSLCTWIAVVLLYPVCVTVRACGWWVENKPHSRLGGGRDSSQQCAHRHGEVLWLVHHPLTFFFASCPSSSPFLVLAEFKRAVISIFHRLPLQSLHLVALQLHTTYPDLLVADLCNRPVPFLSELEISMSYAACSPKSTSITEAQKRQHLYHQDTMALPLILLITLEMLLFWETQPASSGLYFPLRCASWLRLWLSIFYFSMICL